LNPPLEAFDTAIIIKNRLEMRKLWPFKVKGSMKNSKKESPNITKAGSQTPKNSLYVALLLLEFKHDL